ncbi:MAG: hypothetical protein HZA93_19365 [Verrucomicrobia bacterium]|nr:hypothetical protein [Verrucomicrobiota bacterium]
MANLKWWCVAVASVAASAAVFAQDEAALARARAAQYAGGFGTYAGAPRRVDGRIDCDRLVSELVDLRVTAYSFLIWTGEKDWDDLQLFLPKAAKQGIKVWVTLVPPSESPPKAKNYSEPHRLDFQKWAEEIARLSVREKNLVGWSIDDFATNTKAIGIDKLGAALTAARAINPRLAFFPCVYFRYVTPAFVRDVGPLIDGIFFPYRAESTKANLVELAPLEDEVRLLRERLGADKAVVFMLYASRHSTLGATSAAYCDAALQSARKVADGVIVYVHQDPERSAEKYQIMRRLFREWAAAKR